MRKREKGFRVMMERWSEEGEGEEEEMERGESGRERKGERDFFSLFQSTIVDFQPIFLADYLYFIKLPIKERFLIT